MTNRALVVFSMFFFPLSAFAQTFSSDDCVGPLVQATDRALDKCTNGVLFQASSLPNDSTHGFRILKSSDASADLSFWFGDPNKGGDPPLFSVMQQPDDNIKDCRFSNIYAVATRGYSRGGFIDSCKDSSGGLPMRSCQTQYGRYFEIDADGDGVFDDMKAMFEDGRKVPLNFRILFIPMNWTGTQAAFDAAAHDQVQMFAGSTTLGGCMNTIYVDTLDVSTQNFNFNCSLDDCQVDSVRDYVRKIGKQSSSYDVVVGLAESSPCYPTLGCSNLADTVWVIHSTAPDLAHEIGHIYGLVDEYCSEEAGGDDRCAGPDDINHLSAALGCDPHRDAGCCDNCDDGHGNDYFSCCEGNLGHLGHNTRCIMSGLGAGSRYGLQNWCQECVDRLDGAQEFKCDGVATLPFRSLLSVSMAVTTDGKVRLDEFAVQKGRPTRTDPRGDRFLVKIDTPDGNLFSDDFDPFLYSSRQAKVGYIGYKIPVSFPVDAPPKMPLSVFDRGELVFRGTLYGSPPTASAGGAVQGECSSAQGASVTLDGKGSSDPDGDKLFFQWSLGGVRVEGQETATPTIWVPFGQTQVTLVATDGVYSSAPATTQVTVTDGSPPTFTAVPALHTSLCTKGQIDFGVVAADNCGAPTLSNNAPSVFPIGATAVTWTAKDVAGNATTALQQVTVDLDSSLNVTGEAHGLNDWLTAPVTIALKTQDANCASSLEYSRDQTTWTKYDGPFTYADQGETTLYFRALDKASTPEPEKNQKIRIDTKPPTASGSVLVDGGLKLSYAVADPMPGAGAAGVNVLDQAANITTFVGASGTVSLATSCSEVEIWGEDLAGNQQPVHTKIADSIAPVFKTVPVVHTNHCAIGKIDFGVTATDDCNGAVTLTNDAPAKFPLGTTTVTWTATDATGNTATARQQVEVELNGDAECCPMGNLFDYDVFGLIQWMSQIAIVSRLGPTSLDQVRNDPRAATDPYWIREVHGLADDACVHMDQFYKVMTLGNEMFLRRPEKRAVRYCQTCVWYGPGPKGVQGRPLR